MHCPGYQSNNKQPTGPLILGLLRPSLKNCQLGVTSVKKRQQEGREFLFFFKEHLVKSSRNAYFRVLLFKIFTFKIFFTWSEGMPPLTPSPFLATMRARPRFTRIMRPPLSKLLQSLCREIAFW